ncbi:hypothetical protein GGQ92_002469 [Gracilibacillus halotolerans]|uniref:YtzH-like protein n=1 Tax=Gracilibacillus halotolerans TaxID=74386 RepID=A0A841RR17_9BACI|nr:YtzH-like family protein [Gracilibacillus halotolerans]MBB6513655.1 hypothetical protein [Gracilibacillus halotolerans]
MSLTTKDQLGLLYDLISLHAEECSGSTEECEQISRLITVIKNHPSFNQSALAAHTQAMDRYAKDGMSSTDIDMHIHTYQNDLEKWAMSIKDSTPQFVDEVE